MEQEEYTYEDRAETPYAKVTADKTERRDYQPKNVWELDLSSFVDKIDPADYFATSGEATLKARKLEKDLFKMAGMARKLVNVLKKLKGDDVYLEMTWHDGRLVLKAKNPRKNPVEKLKALEENFCYGDKS